MVAGMRKVANERKSRRNRLKHRGHERRQKTTYNTGTYGGGRGAYGSNVCPCSLGRACKLFLDHCGGLVLGTVVLQRDVLCRRRGRGRRRDGRGGKRGYGCNDRRIGLHD